MGISDSLPVEAVHIERLSKLCCVHIKRKKKKLSNYHPRKINDSIYVALHGFKKLLLQDLLAMRLNAVEARNLGYKNVASDGTVFTLVFKKTGFFQLPEKTVFSGFFSFFSKNTVFWNKLKVSQYVINRTYFVFMRRLF